MPGLAPSVLAAIGLFHTIAAFAPAADNPIQKSIETTKHNDPTNLQRLVTGPTETLKTAIAAGLQPTAELLLTPVANTPTGPYGHAGYYSDADITGQRLTVPSGGGRTFWEAQLRNWGQEQNVRSYEVRVDPSGSLGNNADCGAGPGSCVNAGDLTNANQLCTNLGDCFTEFGAAGATCGISGICDFAFITPTRDDWIFKAPDIFENVLFGCGVTDPLGANCFGALTQLLESRVDDGNLHYLATYVFDVPPNAKGLYALPWVEPNLVTLLGDGGSPPNDILIAAAVPGELDVARCQSAEECNDNNACTTDSCETYCRSDPIPLWNPMTMCCNPLTGDIQDLPDLGPCFETYCTEDGTAIINQFPTGEPCELNDPCIVDTTCNETGECIGTLDIGSTCPKPRYITVTPENTFEELSAIQVTLVSLHHPTPESIPALDFSQFEGQHRWVSEPFDCPNSIARKTSLKCATLTCSPVVFDFSSTLQGQPLHITGDAIIPSSVYQVTQFFGPNPPDDGIVLEVSGIKTSRWGDVAAPFQDPLATTRSQPNVIDLTFVIDKAKDLYQALDKPRVQLRRNSPDPRRPLDIADIGLVSDAINGVPYPYGGPSTCPP